LRSRAKSTFSASEESSLDFDYTNSALLEGEESYQEIPPRKQPKHYEELLRGEKSELLADNQSSAGNPHDRRLLGIDHRKISHVSKSVESSSPLDYLISGSHHHLQDLGQREKTMGNFLKTTDSSPASDNPHSHSEFLNKKDLCADVILHSRSEICAEILDGIKGSAANRQYLQRLLSLGTPQRPSIPKIAELPSESEYPGPLQLSGNDHSAGTSHRNQLELQVDSVAGNQSSVENPHDQEQLGLRARENPNFSSMAGSSLDSDYPDSVLPES